VVFCLDDEQFAIKSTQMFLKYFFQTLKCINITICQQYAKLLTKNGQVTDELP